MVDLRQPKEETAQALLEMAARLWGVERAKALERYIEGMAEDIQVIHRHLPPCDQEPAFFL